MRLYVHGAGRVGELAWPTAARQDAIFPRLLGATMCDRVAELQEAAAGRRVTVLAHSLGAVPAVLAIRDGAVAADALVLAEPVLAEPGLSEAITAVVEQVPTLVVTGGRDESGEAIAGALAKRGAQHTQLRGMGHRVQNHWDFEPVVRLFLGGLP